MNILVLPPTPTVIWAEACSRITRDTRVLLTVQGLGRVSLYVVRVVSLDTPPRPRIAAHFEDGVKWRKPQFNSLFCKPDAARWPGTGEPEPTRRQ